MALFSQPSIVAGDLEARMHSLIPPFLQHETPEFERGVDLREQLEHLAGKTTCAENYGMVACPVDHIPSVTVSIGPTSWHNHIVSSDHAPLANLTIPLGLSLLEALRVIEAGRIRGALVTDERDHLIGIITDGDIRRALIAGNSLETPIDGIIRRDPLTVSRRTSRVDVIDLMRSRDVSFVPILDRDGKVTGLHLLNKMIEREVLPNAALIMAGGRGSRLGDLTKTTPKPLLKVAGRPVIEWILLHLVSEGIRTVYVSVGYLSDQIENHLGDGSNFGCTIHYLQDPEDQPLGSGGPLALLRDAGLEDPIIAMNGDLMTRFDLREMLSAHLRLSNDVTVASLNYSVEIPFGVLAINSHGTVTALSEKPSASWHVNAGIYVINPTEFPTQPARKDIPMTAFIQSCLDRGRQVGGWEIDGDWIDIGRPEDLDTARGTR